MAALGALIRGDLPPAGHPVVLKRSGEPPQFAGYESLWLNSGTAALVLALKLASGLKPEVERPEVVLPAYACPDLVAAAVYAGVVPVLADIGTTDPGYSLPALAAALSSRTVAVVAVNFLGIRERLEDLHALLSERGRILLVEDNAQWFPEPLGDAGLVGDMVCLSFGRGKPVSILGGGALLVKQSRSFAVPALMDGVQVETVGAAVALRLYNLLLHPSAYWMVSRNPLFSLGRTVYKPLTRLTSLPAHRLQILPGNVAAHLGRNRKAERWLHEALANVEGVVDLARETGVRAKRLLRFPVLLPDRTTRDRARERLSSLGLGATSLYTRPLPEIEGVPLPVAAAGTFPGATLFADRLLTLPVHAAVRPVHVERIRDVLLQEITSVG